jgi:alanyl-tRNA synthetase
MRNAYPALGRDAELITTVVNHEEEAFRRTLRQGSALLDEALETGKPLSGAVAFKLHDTFGFPIELTTEIAHTRGIAVDLEGFEAEMSAQRVRARSARQSSGGESDAETWKAILAEFGATEFVGYRELESEGRVLAVIERTADGFTGSAGTAAPDGAALVDVVLARTPFYAEGGGQVGDTGRIVGPAGTVVVLDTKAAGEGLIRHTGYLADGEIEAGEVVVASVDAARRTAIRRNHTATHLLQAALRTVLGTHVQQQGSLVEPDRLRFDFSHFQAMTPTEIDDVERIVNAAVLENAPVRTYETSRAEAEEHGAIAFFGERYGDVVRVVEAGEVSVELCGGTHVHATGTIGPFRITSEGSVGANTRRIFATTGTATLDEFRRQERLLTEAAELLHTPVDEVPAALDRLVGEQRRLEEELRSVQQADLAAVAASIAEGATGAVAVRRDGLDPGTLRELALAVRDRAGIPVGLIGSPDGTKVALVVATLPDGMIDARKVAAEVAKLVGGGGGGSPELATAGGRDVDAIGVATERLGALLAGG